MTSNGVRQLRKLRCCLLALALVPSLMAQNSPLRKELHFEVNPGSVLVLNNQDGTIIVHGVAGREVTVVALVHSNKVEVDNSQSGNRVAVATHVLQAPAGTEGQVDYDVSVPTDSSLKIHTQAGSINVSSFTGNLDMESETARIELRISMLPAINSIRDTATWAVITKSRSRRLRTLAVPALAFNAAESAAPKLSSVDGNPNRMPATRLTRNTYS